MNEERRRVELEILKEFGSTSIGHEALRIQLRDTGFNVTEKQVLDDLDYLQQKDLIKIEKIENRRINITRELASITAYGIDFLEGNTPPITGVSD